MATENNDPSAIRIHLNELKAEFDKAMREGHEFCELKKIHNSIKELEWYLKVLEWEQKSSSNRSSPYNEGRPYL